MKRRMDVGSILWKSELLVWEIDLLVRSMDINTTTRIVTYLIISISLVN